MYGIDGRRDLEETELKHLQGYLGSRPVRIGNGAARQKQLDIYGEIMDAALKLSDYVGKIDDDCLLEHGWIERLLEVHATDDRFGVLGSWRFPDEDFDAELAAPKMVTYPSGHTLLRNLWVQGSGHLMKRRCVERQRPARF